MVISAERSSTLFTGGPTPISQSLTPKDSFISCLWPPWSAEDADVNFLALLPHSSWNLKDEAGAKNHKN